MAGQLWRYEVVLPYKTGVPKDVAINAWHLWTDPTVLLADLNGAADALEAFYHTASPLSGTTNAVSRYISNFVDRDHCRIDVTRVDNWASGTISYVPVHSQDMAMLTPIGTPLDLPLEVAVVNSLLGTTSVDGTNPIPDVVRQRRGRVFLGPLNTDAAHQEADGRPDVKADFMVDVTHATKTLVTDTLALGLGDVCQWVVWSRTSRRVSRITEGHCNNDFDTQRRRGAAETSRSIWSL